MGAFVLLFVMTRAGSVKRSGQAVVVQFVVPRFIGAASMRPLRTNLYHYRSGRRRLRIVEGWEGGTPVFWLLLDKAHPYQPRRLGFGQAVATAVDDGAGRPFAAMALRAFPS